MITRRTVLVAAALGVGAFATGFAVSRWLRSGSGPIIGSAAVSPLTHSGEAAPDFHFVDQHGAEHRFSDWHDQIRVVNFWATWCPPCVHEIPVLVAIQNTFHARGVRIIGVASDTQTDAFVMAKAFKVNYPTMADPRRSLKLMRAYGNRSGGLPFTVFVDTSGTIRERYTGALTLEEAQVKIQALLS